MIRFKKIAEEKIIQFDLVKISNNDIGGLIGILVDVSKKLDKQGHSLNVSFKNNFLPSDDANLVT